MPVRRLPEALSFPSLMATDSVGTADVASKMTRWSPQPARVAADEQLFLRILVAYDQTYSIISSDSISTLKLKLYGRDYMELQVLDASANSVQICCL